MSSPAQSPSEAAERPALGPSDLVDDRYRLEREVRRDELGIVFEALDETNDRTVALQIATSLTDPTASARFARGAAIAQRLEGEHVLRVLDVGALPDGTPYVVREPSISTLEAEVLSRGAVPIPEAVGWTLEACEAIAEAHALGLAHGDFRPEAVVLARSRDGVVIVKVAWTTFARVDDITKADVQRDIAGLGGLLATLATGEVESDAAPTLPNLLAGAVARAQSADAAFQFSNVAELARAIARYAPPGHSSARNVAFLLSRAGVVGAAIPLDQQTAPGVPEGLADAWFDAPLSEPRAHRRRALAFSVAALALIGAAVGSTFAARDTRLEGLDRSVPEPVSTTRLNSAEIGTEEHAAAVSEQAIEEWSIRRALPPSSAATPAEPPVDELDDGPLLDERKAVPSETPP